MASHHGKSDVRLRQLILFVVGAVFLVSVVTLLSLVFVRRTFGTFERGRDLEEHVARVRLETEAIQTLAEHAIVADAEQLPSIADEYAFHLARLKEEEASLTDDRADDASIAGISVQAAAVVAQADEIIGLRSTLDARRAAVDALVAQLIAGRESVSRLLETAQARIQLGIVESGYREQEFLWRYRDEPRAARWEEAISAFLADLKASGIGTAVPLWESYQELADRTVAAVQARELVVSDISYHAVNMRRSAVEAGVFLDRIARLAAGQRSAASRELLLAQALAGTVILAGLFLSWIVLFAVRGKIEDLFGEVQAQGARLAAIMGNTADCIKLFDREGTLLFVNAGGLREHGFKDLAEAAGWDYLTTLDEASRAAAREGFARALMGETSDVDVRHLPRTAVRGGSDREWCNVVYSPITDAAGRVVNVAAISRDTSEHQRGMEEKRRYTERLEVAVAERTRSLEDYTERYRSVTEASLVGLYALQDGVFRYVNPAFLRIFGYDRVNEVAGRRWEEFVLPEDVQVVRASGLAQRMAGSGPEVRYGFRGVRKDGGVIDVEVQSRASVFNGKPAAIGSLQDVTERKRAEARIKELNDLREQFIRIVSHQLRTPLSSIRWNLEALLGEELGKLPKEQKGLLRVTEEATVKVIERIHDMLTAMDIEEGRVTLAREPVSLASLWASVAGEWRKRCAVKDLVCDARMPSGEDASLVLGDAEKLRDALAKLADNAVSYTREKGKVAVRISRTGDRVRFEIADTGIGIPKREQPRIGKRFFRASNAPLMLPDASGIGLSIAMYYVERHGGKLAFASTEGKGSTFWFELPAAP